MVFSGVLAKGKINPAFLDALGFFPNGNLWKKRILAAYGKNNNLRCL
jgi:hypothetical protein